MDLLFGVALVLGVMILVHEWGHFIAARIFGVRVDVFSIGFGPRLFGWKHGATDYRVSALPARLVHQLIRRAFRRRLHLRILVLLFSMYCGAARRVNL